MTTLAEKILAKTNFDLRVYNNGKNVIEAWYKSNGKQMLFHNSKGIIANTGGTLSNEELNYLLDSPITKKQFKKNVGNDNELTVYIGR